MLEASKCVTQATFSGERPIAISYGLYICLNRFYLLFLNLFDIFS